MQARVRRRASLDGLTGFYERITGVTAVRYPPVFAELSMPTFTLAIGHTQTTKLFGEDSARPAENRSVIVEFKVDDVDAEFERLAPMVDEWVQKPTTMPWGNRSILFRDPDGNLVNCFTPVTEEAISRAGGTTEPSRPGARLGQASWWTNYARAVQNSRLWADHDVCAQTMVCKTFRHPLVGPVLVDCDVLDITTVTNGSSSTRPSRARELKRRLLSVVGTQRMNIPG